MLRPIISILEGGAVKRFHTVPLIQHYDVAQHSWGMAVLAHLIHPAPSKELLLGCLLHDVQERYLGDIPWPAKAMCPELGDTVRDLEEQVERALGIDIALSPEDVAWLRALDTLELLLFCSREKAMGNRNVEGPLRTCRDLLLSNDRGTPDEVRGFVDRYEWERTPDFLEDL